MAERSNPGLERLSVPELPAVIGRLRVLRADPETRAADLVALIEADPRLAMDTVEIANGAYGLCGSPWTDVDAVVRGLGGLALEVVLLRSCLIRRYEYLEYFEAFDLDGLWRHAALTAQLAELLGSVTLADERACGWESGLLRLCGWLHDFGQVVMLDSFADAYAQMAARLRTSGEPSAPAEVRAFGFSHAQAGQRVVEEWGLPDEVGVAIASHHGVDGRVDQHGLTAVLSLADALARLAERGSAEIRGLVDHPACTAWGVEPLAAQGALEHGIDALATNQL